MQKKKAAAAAVFTGFIIAGLPFHTDVTKYQLITSKVNTEITFLILSDLHNDCDEERIRKLEKKIRELHPDFILMPGDMCEENFHQEQTLKLMAHLHDIPMFYSTGNHEEYRWDIAPLMERIEDAGVTVLDNSSVIRTFQNTQIEIGGLRCPKHMSGIPENIYSNLFQSEHYRILLSHRPNWIQLYDKIDCDLVVSGHAHGGQWRILGTDIAAIAPDQGIFPKYTSGMHELNDGKKLIISRGLVRHYHHIPRLYNNPEIVQVKLKPEEKYARKTSTL